MRYPRCEASNAHSFIVTAVPNSETHQPELQILAQKDYQYHPGSWEQVTGKKRLSSKERIGFDVVLKQLKVGQAGYTELPF